MQDLLLLSSRLLLLLGDRVQIDSKDILDCLVGHSLLCGELGSVQTVSGQKDDSLGRDQHSPLELSDDVFLLLNQHWVGVQEAVSETFAGTDSGKLG